MSNDEFEAMVKYLANSNASISLKDILYYNVSGMTSDAGEVLDVLKKYFYYKNIDKDALYLHLAEELSDVLHWLQATCNALGFSLNDIMRVNEAKLRVRYPNGWEEVACTNRDKAEELEAMREVLTKIYQEKGNEC